MSKKIESKKTSRKKIGHVTSAGKSALADLFPEEAVSMEMRSMLMNGLQEWFDASGLTQTAAAQILGVSQARVSHIARGKLSAFSIDLLIRLAARAGLHPHMKLSKVA